jgi:hypothetical protein
MPPKSSVHDVDTDVEGQPSSLSGKKKMYQDVLANAGKVHLEPPQIWGKGIVQDFKKTVGTYWFQVRRPSPRSLC